MSRFRRHQPFAPLVLGFFLAFCACGFSTAGEELKARVDAAAQAQVDSQNLVGLAVGLIRRGELVHLGGYGHADREAGTPVDPRKTMFRWASISKPLTAISAIQLAEEGRLDLDKSIRDYVPEFPDKGVTITLRQLLSHTGGIVHYSNGKVIKTRRKYDSDHPFADVVLALDKFKESPLVHPPGESFAYTTHGYILASAVVQRAGGSPFHSQIAERIANPLGMKTLQPDYAWLEIPNRAKGYRKPKKGSSDGDVSWKLGGGGFISTVEDLTLFAQGLIEGRLLSAESYEQMWTPVTPADGKSASYGLGFGIGGEGRDFQVSHSGSQAKARTLMVVFPKQRSALTIMTNSEYADTRAIAQALAPMLRVEEAVAAP